MEEVKEHCFWSSDITEFTTWFRMAFLKGRQQIFLVSLVFKANVHRRAINFY